MALIPTTNQQIYSDLDISLNMHPVTHDLLLKTGAQAVVQAVLDLVQLNHYDIPFHPEIGGNVRKLLFEIADPTTANLLAEEIRNVIKNFEPRASVTDVNVQTNANGDGYVVTINFYVVGIPNQLSIQFFLARIR